MYKPLIYPKGSLYVGLFYLFLQLNWTAAYPMIPAQKDDIKIMNFELLIISEWLNARSVMNIDIVNPIPPRIATENNMLHEIFCGNVQILIFTARNANKKMPTGLPISRPKNIPNE